MIELIYDTETTGLPDWKVPSEAEHQPHIVQLAAVLAERDEIRIAHNEQFDARIVRIATKRYCSEDVQKDWKEGAKFCTMRKSMNILKLPNTTGHGGAFKFPRLEEAYRFFAGEEMKNAHSAMGDVKAVNRVYQGILEHCGEKP